MKITNPPKPIELVDYDNAIDKYAQKLKMTAGVRALYTMGSTNAPGLSDLDFVVVVDNNFNPNDSSKLNVNGIDNRILLHGPIVAPESLLSKLQYIFYIDNLKLIQGVCHYECNVGFEGLMPIEKKTLSACYLLDFLQMRLIQFALARHEGVLNQRHWLTRIWSMTHSLKIADSLGLALSKTEKSWEHIIRETRLNWLKHGRSDEKEFINAFECAEMLAKSIFTNTLTFVYSKLDLSRVATHRVRLNNKTIEFNKKNIGVQVLLKQLNILNKSLRVIKMATTPEYSIHLGGYGLMKNQLDLNPELAAHYQVMNMRKKTVIAHANWVDLRVPLSGSMRGEIGMPTSVGSTFTNKFINWVGAVLVN